MNKTSKISDIEDYDSNDNFWETMLVSTDPKECEVPIEEFNKRYIIPGNSASNIGVNR